MIITIDGPAGSGKSTAARKLAAALGLAYLDTGAMYRAIALKALETGVPLDDPDALTELAGATDLRLDCGPTSVRVVMDGRDVSETIRSMRVNQSTNAVSRTQGVRQVLIAKQREIGRQLGSFVSEGRDQGSTVFPDADVRFLLDAADTARAERRCRDLQAAGEEVPLAVVLENVRQRDRNDQRQWAPLLASGGATRIDTTDMTIDEVVDRMRRDVERHRGNDELKTDN